MCRLPLVQNHLAAKCSGELTPKATRLPDPPGLYHTQLFSISSRVYKGLRSRPHQLDVRTIPHG